MSTCRMCQRVEAWGVTYKELMEVCGKEPLLSYTLSLPPPSEMRNYSVYYGEVPNLHEFITTGEVRYGGDSNPKLCEECTDRVVTAVTGKHWMKAYCSPMDERGEDSDRGHIHVLPLKYDLKRLKGRKRELRAYLGEVDFEKDALRIQNYVNLVFGFQPIDQLYEYLRGEGTL